MRSICDLYAGEGFPAGRVQGAVFDQLTQLRFQGSWIRGRLSSEPGYRLR